MAKLPEPKLRFQQVSSGADPGLRVVDLPPPLPAIGDDFDWELRDFQGFRDFMLGELQARFPERQRWTPADMEVVLIEILATALDHLSDMADRAAAEGTLITARRPQSVEQWLRLIGMDPAQERFFDDKAPPEKWSENLHALYRASPHEMERDRRRGPGTIHRQERMVCLQDYEESLREHPLVFRARARQQWEGAWPVIRVAVLLQKNARLDDRPPHSYPLALVEKVEKFHSDRDLYFDRAWQDNCTVRDLLSSYLEQYRAVGQVVYLQDVVQVGVDLSVRVRIRPQYFQSELGYEVMSALGRGPGGFFEPGRFAFGQDVPASDIFERLMNVAGVEHVQLVRFRRVGHPDQEIVPMVYIQDNEVAICDNDGRHAARGTIALEFTGGRTG